MTPAALIMLVLTVVIVWGGLVATTVALRTLRTPDAAEAADPGAEAPAATAPAPGAGRSGTANVPEVDQPARS